MTSWTTFPEPPVDGAARVAQRAQVVLDRLELAEGDAGERRVLPVRGEEPRVVREARAEEARGGQRAARRGVALARVDLAQLEVEDLLHRVGQVLLAPLDALGQERVAGQGQPRVARQALALGHLRGQRAGGVAQHPRERRLGLLRARHRARDAEPHGRLAARGHRDLVAQAPAAPAAVLRVVAALGRLRRVGPGGRADDRP